MHPILLDAGRRLDPAETWLMPVSDFRYNRHESGFVWKANGLAGSLE